MLTAIANHCPLPVMPPTVLSLSPPLLFLVPLLLLRDGCRCLCVHVCGQAVCRELCM